MGDRIDAFRARFPNRFTYKFRVDVSFVGISVTDADFYPNSLLGVDPEKRQILNSMVAQLQLEETLQNEKKHASFWKALANEAVHKPTEELRQPA